MDEYKNNKRYIGSAFKLKKLFLNFCSKSHLTDKRGEVILKML